jgi:hypothetical protein
MASAEPELLGLVEVMVKDVQHLTLTFEFLGPEDGEVKIRKVSFDSEDLRPAFDKLRVGETGKWTELEHGDFYLKFERTNLRLWLKPEEMSIPEWPRAH